MRRALIVGATGLIGNELLYLLLDDPHYSSVTAVTRKPLNFTHPRLRIILTDFSMLEKELEGVSVDDIFCCLGTTMAQAKTKLEFRKVDYDYPVLLANKGPHLGAKQFLLVSAMGADKNSIFFYNQVKGEVEEAVLATGFACVHIFRPSLLLGIRPQKRHGEVIGERLTSLFKFMIPEKYKAIKSAKVAKAMLYWANKDDWGHFIHDSAEMNRSLSSADKQE